MRLPKLSSFCSIAFWIIALTVSGLEHRIFAQEGTPEFPTAINTLLKAAEQGDTKSQLELAKAYKEGRGIESSSAEAAKWFRKAAEQGNSQAQLELGKMFDSGTGLSQSYAEAVRWYRKSAEQGNADAQFALGDMYASGQGVTSDYLQAYMWLTLSAAGSNDKTMPARLRDSLLKQMTSRQIEEAEQLVRDWKPVGAHTLKADQIGNDMSNGPYYVGDHITDPIPLAKPSPQFTEAARQAGINGTVVVRGVVRKDGKVDSLEVVKGLGFGLDESAIETIASMWRFEPGKKDGIPVDVVIQIEVSFARYRAPRPPIRP